MRQLEAKLERVVRSVKDVIVHNDTLGEVIKQLGCVGMVLWSPPVTSSWSALMPLSLSSSDEEAMEEEPIPTQGCGVGHAGSGGGAKLSGTDDGARVLRFPL